MYFLTAHIQPAVKRTRACFHIAQALGCSGVFKNVFEIRILMTVAQNQVLEAEELGPE